MLGDSQFLDKWVELTKFIRDWHTQGDESPYSIEGNKSLLTVQSLRVFENIFKVWSDNVPVKKDASAMAEMRGHRIRLARAYTSAPDVSCDLIMTINF